MDLGLGHLYEVRCPYNSFEICPDWNMQMINGLILDRATLKLLTKKIQEVIINSTI
jgi:hypothetical protein